MAFSVSYAKPCVAIACCFLLLSSWPVLANDPDPVQDYCVADLSNSIFINGLPCKNPAQATSADFTTSILSSTGDTSANPMGIAVSFAYAATFAGLNTQGLSIARIAYAANGGLVPPHVHPRSSELIFVLEGMVLVGFVDTTNKLFAQTLYTGDLFVFPRGLVHYTLNPGNVQATTLSSFNSQNPGFSLLNMALFATMPTFPDIVLEKSFDLTMEQVESIKKMLAG